MNILFLDPDEYYQAQYQNKFSDLGEIRIQGEGAGLMQILASFTPEVVVCELLLSDTTIYALLEKLREVLMTRSNVKIIIFSRIGKIEDIEAAMEYGITNFLVKGQDTLSDLKNLLLTTSYV